MTEEDFIRERDKLNLLTGHDLEALARQRDHEELLKLRRNNEKLKWALIKLMSCLSLTTRKKRARRWYVDDWHMDDFAREVRNAEKVLKEIKR